ncbi:MAG: DUF3575 domain-containing protein [Bacteroidales bacterium]|nr:DUF3575 domain-containing protein [Bacteroidales bacterium]
MKRSLILSLVLAVIGISAKGQDVALKTNLLSDAVADINLGIEIGLAPRWTLNVGGEFNDWLFRAKNEDGHDRRWKHWGVEPEARYWLCDRFAGHFLALNVFTGQYNVGGVGKDFRFLGTDYGATISNRYQGWFVGAGIGYGYDFVLGKHWNLEPEICIGYAYMTYEKFACTGCGQSLGTGDHNYWGVTKAAINLVYVF